MRRALLLLAAATTLAGGASPAAAFGPPAERSYARVGLAAVAPPGGDARSCSPGDRHAVGDRRAAFAITLRRDARPFGSPGRDPGEPLPARLENGLPTVLAVTGAVVDGACRPVWLRVLLPVPGGVEAAYVRAGVVELYRVVTRIEIDLSERRLRFLRGGRLLETVPVAVGAPETPTPIGRFYVNQRIRSTNPAGPYGPGALGIATFSAVLTDWAEGGPVAIHGTNDPASIGRAVSHGCIRVTNDVLLALFRATPSGTPVIVRA